jgi:DNA-binding CsgD family transcriptional regulator
MRPPWDVPGSEAAALARAFDWSATPLGPPAQWPPSLLSAVSLCLNSRFPMAVLAGPRMICIYNDDYAPILGPRHPHSMGRPINDIFPEVWPLICPMLRGVLAGGPAVRFDDRMLVLERRGFGEECYFTFSYSPVYEPDGAVSGVLVTVIETTVQVVAARRTAALATIALAGGAALATRLASCQTDLPAVTVYLGGAGATYRRVLSTGLAPARIMPPGPPGGAQLVHCPLDWARALPQPGRGRPVTTLAWHQVTPGGRPFLVALAINPLAPLDEAYQFFLQHVGRLLGSAMLPDVQAGGAALTAREREVVRLIGAGCQIKQVAATLGITISSVNTYRQRVFRKLGLTSNAGLIRYALEHHLVDPSVVN